MNTDTTPESEKPNLEKLRDELFDTRVDLKVWIRSMKVIASSVTVLLAILAFFGYNKIQYIESSILERANQRLAKTDTLLSKIDENRINELNKRLNEKERDYKLALVNFEKLISKSKELEEKLLSSLPVNERIMEWPLKKYIEESPSDYFEVRPFKSSFGQNEKTYLYLVFDDKFGRE